jgi:hypothetical protein
VKYSGDREMFKFFSHKGEIDDEEPLCSGQQGKGRIVKAGQLREQHSSGDLQAGDPTRSGRGKMTSKLSGSKYSILRFTSSLIGQ